MDHLYNSVVRAEELSLTVLDGTPTMDWVPAVVEGDEVATSMLAYLRCRLDMTFVRPGKDIMPAPEAGKAPDRIGVMFTYAYAPIKAGMRIVAIPNDYGEIPVEGSFEIRAIPDTPNDFRSRHHIEVQVIETNQNLTLANWPAEEPIEDDVPEEPEP